MRVFPLALLPALALLASPAFAVDTYVGVGTTGLMVGVEQNYTPSFGVRVDLNALSLSRDTSDSNATYHGNLHLADLALLGDYHPFAGGFRVTAGTLLGNSYFQGHADGTSTGTFTLNGVTVTALGQTLDASIKFPAVRPYVGIGWGHSAQGTGLSFTSDIGVAVGRPSVSLTASQGLITAALASGTSVDAERARLQDQADKLRLYPVVRVGLGWGF